MHASDAITVYQYDKARRPPGYVPVQAGELVCDGCGADAGTDEKKRGLYYDRDADEAICVRCRCGMVWFATRTDENISRATLRLLAHYFDELGEGPDGVLAAEGYTNDAARFVALRWVAPRAGWREVKEWRILERRVVWVNDGEWAILHYLEGQLRVAFYPHPAMYEAAYANWKGLYGPQTR